MIQYLEFKKMSFYSYHGVAEQERKVGNIYNVDLKIFFKNQKVMYTDCLQDSINYVFIYEIVKKEMSISSNLIEHVAHRILRKIRENFPNVTNIEIRLSKQNPPIKGDIREISIFIAD